MIGLMLLKELLGYCVETFQLGGHTNIESQPVRRQIVGRRKKLTIILEWSKAGNNNHKIS